MHKYFLYARKSTDNEERQVLSIEAQLAELREFSKKENLEIICEFVESKTAKQPGRAIFNDMLLRIESGEADGIIAWNPDRLARNAVDGGQIINLIDKGKLQSLKFPTYWFETSSQGLFMLQIAFGQAKYYIDNLSENVKRGLRQKLRRGEWPGLAPIGYINNLRTHIIEIDKEKGAIVKKLFEQYATGKFTFSDLEKLSLSLGLVSNKTNRRGLPISVLQKMLSNVFYIGLFVYSGETYEGKHEPLISKATFDTVQRILDEKSRPRKTKELINFPYRGVFTCGECGKAITGERHKKKSGLIFRYYRCTKKGTTCKQKYLPENKFGKQVDEIVSKVALPDSWANLMFSEVDKWQTEENKTNALAVENTKVELAKIEARLSKLLDAHLDGLLEMEEYQNKKAELLKKKLALKQKIARKGNQWLEPLRNWIKDAHQANNLLLAENFEAKAELLQKIGSNRIFQAQQISLTFENAWKILPKWNAEARSAEASNSKNAELTIVRGAWDEVRTYIRLNTFHLEITL
ncbi:MAG: recombinase family protein [Candidatus Moraniibacteriota bacterium]